MMRICFVYERMEHTHSPLPSFENPPVVEVALSVQFDPIEALQVPQMGLLWSRFRDDLPKTQTQPPLQLDFERFGTIPDPIPRVRIQAFDIPPVPRLWFLNETETELVQVQQTRFIANWRRVKDESYPRFDTIFQKFKERIGIFLTFLSDEHLPSPVYNQCEVTYVNHIPADAAPSTHGTVERLLTTWKEQYSDEFLHDPEDIMIRLRYLIPGGDQNPVGRLHVDLQPALKEDQTPIFVLNITARCNPIPRGLEGVYKSFELCHEWIVKGFASITTRSMHQIWRRNI
ncbi:MAG TPA: TIGR04255 family protein [Terriglobia bacterium]|nr:TIGR04255 family protein [Terriglobia bacterium]